MRDKRRSENLIHCPKLPRLSEVTPVDYPSNLITVKAILRARMNMCNIPGKCKNDGDGLCNLCEEEEGVLNII